MGNKRKNNLIKKLTRLIARIEPYYYTEFIKKSHNVKLKSIVFTDVEYFPLQHRVFVY